MKDYKCKNKIYIGDTIRVLPNNMFAAEGIFSVENIIYKSKDLVECYVYRLNDGIIFHVRPEFAEKV